MAFRSQLIGTFKNTLSRCSLQVSFSCTQFHFIYIHQVHTMGKLWHSGHRAGQLQLSLICDLPRVLCCGLLPFWPPQFWNNFYSWVQELSLPSLIWWEATLWQQTWAILIVLSLMSWSSHDETMPNVSVFIGSSRQRYDSLGKWHDLLT